MRRLLRSHWRASIALALVVVLVAACGPPLGQPRFASCRTGRGCGTAPTPRCSCTPARPTSSGRRTTGGCRFGWSPTTPPASPTSRAQWAGDGGRRDAGPAGLGRPGESQIWAPSVARIGTQFVMYFAARHAGRHHRRGATTSASVGPSPRRRWARTPPRPARCTAGTGRRAPGHGLPGVELVRPRCARPRGVPRADGALYLAGGAQPDAGQHRRRDAALRRHRRRRSQRRSHDPRLAEHAVARRRATTPRATVGSSRTRR